MTVISCQRACHALLIAALALPGATTVVSADDSVPMTLVIERSEDAFIAPEFLNYMGNPASLIAKLEGRSPSVGALVFGGYGGETQTERSLRTLLGKHDAPVSGPAFAELFEQSYFEAGKRYLWSNIDQTVSMTIAAELPEGRPDYRAVTRANALAKKTILNKTTATVTARPAILRKAGQLSLWTKFALRKNKANPDWPKRFFTDVIIFSEALGEKSNGLWFENDQARYKAFMRCAAAESMQIIRLAMDDKLRAGKGRFHVDGDEYLTDEAYRVFGFGAPYSPVERRDHRLRTTYGGNKNYTSVVVSDSDVLGGARAIPTGPGVEECMDESGAY